MIAHPLVWRIQLPASFAPQYLEQLSILANQAEAGPDSADSPFLDTLRLESEGGDIREFAVPPGVFTLWFGRHSECIVASPFKLVILNSCPHTWDGLDQVSMITVDLEDEVWSQQSLGEPSFVRDFLGAPGRVPASAVDDWGNDVIGLILGEGGRSLKLTSSASEEYPVTVYLRWECQRWAVDSAVDPTTFRPCSWSRTALSPYEKWD